MSSLPSYRVMGPTVNIISGTHHLCERETIHLFVVLDYWIITHDCVKNMQLRYLGIRLSSNLSFKKTPLLYKDVGSITEILKICVCVSLN